MVAKHAAEVCPVVGDQKVESMGLGPETDIVFKDSSSVTYCL